jgi:hypothetical protein
LAWARAHHVTLGEDVRAELLCESHEDHGHRRCCKPEADDHASGGRACGKCGEQQDAAKSRWVWGFQAQKCHGLTLLWVAIGATLPVEIRSLWEYDWLQVGKVCTAADGFSPLFFEPSVPPPRV